MTVAGGCHSQGCQAIFIVIGFCQENRKLIRISKVIGVK